MSVCGFRTDPGQPQCMTAGPMCAEWRFGFTCSGGGDTDLIAMTLPEFFSPTPEDFLAFAEAAKPKPYKGESPWQKIFNLLHLVLPKRDPYPGETISPDDGAIEFADKNPAAQLGVLQAAQIGAPVSYVRAAYHAVHTFVVTDPNKIRRWVRFSWQPIAGGADDGPQSAAERRLPPDRN